MSSTKKKITNKNAFKSEERDNQLAEKHMNKKQRKDVQTLEMKEKRIETLTR